MKNKKDLWPELNWSEWRDTEMTLHLFTQIIGKIRLALMPMQSEWAQVPLTVNSKGISSPGMITDFGSLDIEFNFNDHRIYFYASSGKSFSFALKDKSVASFYKETMEALTELEVKMEINPMSVEMETPVKMDTDEEHGTYKEDLVLRWWHTLVIIGNTFNKFRSKFSGKQTPVCFYWGSFDLAVSFFSGKFLKPAPEFDLIYRVAMDSEQTTIGFWTGSDAAPEAVFFAYTYPKPDGLENEILNPSAAAWSAVKGEFILPYEYVRNQDDPEATLLEFCESSYSAGCKLAGWDMTTLEHKPPLEKPKP
jgi:hypothetical protein